MNYPYLPPIDPKKRPQRLPRPELHTVTLVADTENREGRVVTCCLAEARDSLSCDTPCTSGSSAETGININNVIYLVERSVLSEILLGELN